MFVKLRTTPAVTAAKASPSLHAVLGDAVDSARPLLRRMSGPQPAGLDRLLVVRLPPDADVPVLAAKLSRLPEVEYAQPVWVYETTAVPNDPAYSGGMQAYLANLQVQPAWDVQKAQNGSPRPVVCVVDGGTNWQHEDLIANMWSNPGEIAGNFLDDDGNGFIDDVHGWNFRDDNGNPRGTDGNGNHGTHTGGLLAAVTDNGVGVACTSWNPLLLAVIDFGI
jgi:subtilisin family serine protease